MLSADQLKAGEREKIKIGGWTLWFYWEVQVVEQVYDDMGYPSHVFGGVFVVEGQFENYKFAKRTFADYEDAVKEFNSVLERNAIAIAKQAFGINDE